LEHWKVVTALIVGLWAGYNFLYMRPFHGRAGTAIDLTAEPVQNKLEEQETVEFQRGNKKYIAVLKFNYSIQGRVIMASTYSVFYHSDLLVVDVGLGWGKKLDWMLDNLDFDQGGRWLFWQTRKSISAGEKQYIESHLSNNHLIPAGFDWNMEKALRWIKQGDDIKIQGYLVTLKTRDGKVIIRSSTTRTDTGAGACEVIWVEKLQIGDTMYSVPESLMAKY